MRSLLKPPFILLVCILLSSCNKFEFDFNILSVLLVPGNDIEGVIGKDHEIPAIHNRRDGNFVVVQIESEQNYWSIVKGSDAVVSVESRFCETPITPVVLGLPHLYSRGVNVSMGPHISTSTPDQFGPSVTNKRHRYQIIIFEAWQEKIRTPLNVQRESGLEYYLNYDITKEPQDICLEVILSEGRTVIGSKAWRLTASEISQITK